MALSEQLIRRGQLVRGYELLAKACELHDERACLDYAIHSAMRHKGERRERALATITTQCDANVAEACLMLARFLLPDSDAELAPDLPRARKLLEKLCGAEVGQACALLGIMFDNGWDTAVDHAKAVSLFTRSCDLADTAGCGQLGSALYEGKGTQKDAAKGLALMKESCEHNYPFACWRLGRAYAAAPIANDTMARAAFDKACTWRAVPACTELGYMLRTGAGGPPDPSKALHSFEYACASRHGVACLAAAEMLERGDGVPKNIKVARELLSQACDLGVKKACVSEGPTLP